MNTNAMAIELRKTNTAAALPREKFSWLIFTPL